MTRRTPAALSLTVAATLLGTLLVACSGSGEKVTPNLTITPRNTDPLVRGTIGTMATTTAGQPVLVSGYGIVAGLNGTGGGVLPEPIAVTMERDLALRGVGRAATLPESSPLRDPLTGRPKTPREVLEDPNIAVVLVQGVMARAAPGGFEFDLAVRALNATSLIGGTLWTTDLNLGPPSNFGETHTRRLATGQGPVFVNPFEDPAAPAGDASGRVLAGGVVTDPLAVQIALDPPSYSRARQVETAIRSRFPRGRYDEGPVARGRDDRLIDLNIPFQWRDRPSEFLRVIEHMQADTIYPETHARRYLAAVRDDPARAQTVSMLLWGLGAPAVPFARELYDDPDPRLRMTGLRAGAKLGDAMSAEQLAKLATQSGAYQLEAIVLLGQLDSGPSTDQVLRELAASGPLTARAAAYEALVARATRIESGSLAQMNASRYLQNADRHATPAMEELAALRLSGSTIQGVQRRPVGGAFLLDRVPWGEPLIYVTQQNRPRVVIFGADPVVPRPTLVSVWDGRLLLLSDSAEAPLRVSYQSYRSPKPFTKSDLPDDVSELVKFLGHRPSPEDPRPGLGLSYGEVVGVLAAISDSSHGQLPFSTEEDRLVAAIAEARASRSWEERPETAADLAAREQEEDEAPGIQNPREVKPQVVPLPGAAQPGG